MTPLLQDTILRALRPRHPATTADIATAVHVDPAIAAVELSHLASLGRVTREVRPFTVLWSLAA